MTTSYLASSDDKTAAEDPGAPLLELEDLHVEFRTREGVARAVNGVSYTVEAGKTLAVLGESGSGKSVTAQAIMGILDTPPAFIPKGEVRFKGRNLLRMPERERRTYRGRRIAMVFQDALSALNPVFPVGDQIGEMFRVHEGLSKRAARAKAIDAMDAVRIPAARQRVGDYPHQFSGGMRQRIMIAMAIALNPEVLIADEPTTALDVTVQAQIMDLLGELQRERNMGMILITHDLGVVADVADRIAVMYAGRIVEEASVFDIYSRPAHPYTKGLLESVPRVDEKNQRLRAVEGLPPNLMRIPSGCPFHPRCPYKQEPVCTTERPPLYQIGPGTGAACHFWEDVRAESQAEFAMHKEGGSHAID
ncbi:oligopeptide transport system ATP-binding protein [Motilibacter peucedani]|uniref:Oligopeptide transport system ATP-binding protein n=1 Tax=Motilibacter peucedani TaxID=598650 RepID=A0A420XMG0_9ACTN|nr:ABC transporter ATP-binding protein [Motilibacter peucedani]RKS72415.1 oligopeptide transport system ATP-binding protein [Motilibacter peucedani]